MLHASRLSCSCQEATVSLPPSLYVGPLFPPVGEQAASSTVPIPATTSSRNERGLAPLMRPPSESSRADQRQALARPTSADDGQHSTGGQPKGSKKARLFQSCLTRGPLVHPPVRRVPQGGVRRGVRREVVQMRTGH